MIQVRVDSRAGIAELKKVEQLDRAIPMALNRTASKTRTFMKRYIAGDTGLKSGTVDKALSVHRATAQNPRAVVNVRGKRIPLIEFGAKGPYPSRGKGGGVTYNLGGPKRISDAFIAVMKSGHKGVFKRVTSDRLPIVELFGPSLVKVFAKGMESGVEYAERELVKELESALRITGQSAAA